MAPEVKPVLEQVRKSKCSVSKLARAKLPANAGNFTCSSQVKRSHTQFTCVTCSLPVKTGNYTCFYAASISRRIFGLTRAKFFSDLWIATPNVFLANSNIKNHHSLQDWSSFTFLWKQTYWNLPANDTWSILWKELYRIRNNFL